MDSNFKSRDKSSKPPFLRRTNLIKIILYAHFIGVYFLNRARNRLELSFQDVSKPELSISIFYINLDHRRDRYSSISSEFRRLKFSNAIRVSGILRSPGGLGCSLSHKAALNLAKLSNASISIIIEDDAIFLRTRKYINKILQSFQDDPKLDVLCLGYFLTKRPEREIGQFMEVKDVQTTVCYALKNYMIDKMIGMTNQSIERYEKDSTDPFAAIDQTWKILQKESVFVIPRKPTVIQKPSYSDVASGFAVYAIGE